MSPRGAMVLAACMLALPGCDGRSDDDTVGCADQTPAIWVDLLDVADATGTGNWEILGDLNGDGIDELGLAIPGWDGGAKLQVFYGPFEGNLDNRRPAATITQSAANPYTMMDGGPIGDLDGDGNGDLWVDVDYERTWFFSGPVTGDIDLDDHQAAFGQQNAGVRRGPVGDLNGDGLDDIVIWDWENYFVLHSPQDLPLSGADVVIPRSASLSGFEDVYLHLGGPVDFDGDGAHDLVFDADGRLEDCARLGTAACTRVFLLSADQPGRRALDSDSFATLTVHDESYAWEPKPAGDVDGDGEQDLLLAYGMVLAGNIDDPGIYIEHGPFEGDRSPGLELAIGSDLWDGTEHHIGGPLDIDADGVSDIAFNLNDMDRHFTWGSNTHLFLGPVCTTIQRNDGGVILDPPSEHRVWRTHAAGDLNGDGVNDLLLQGYSYADYYWHVHLVEEFTWIVYGGADFMERMETAGG